MSWQSDGPGRAARVLISFGALILVFLTGAKTEWMAISSAAQSDRRLDDRAFEAAVLGRTRTDATSAELIDAAAVRGEISPEQALLYGVYLACGDPRLPLRYQGRAAGPPDLAILSEADVDWATLSPDTREALGAIFASPRSGQPALACADEIARLAGDAAVWWSPALRDAAPAQVANAH